MKIFIIVVVCVYLAFDIVTAKMMTAKEMKEHFIDNQCIVGKIAANIFYAPAWFLKGLKFIINVTVK